MATQPMSVPRRKAGEDGLCIGYVLKRYPRLSETFIVQEILEMEQRGADLVLFPIMDPQESLRNRLVQEVRAPVVYLQRSLLRDAPGMLVDHARLALASPRRYRQAVRHLLEGTGSRPASLRAFLQAGRLARLATRMGVNHLHAHFAHNPTSLARYAGLLTGLPYSFTAHAKDLYLTRPQSIADKTSLATFVSTCTGYNADYLRQIVQPRDREKVCTVYHGVDTDRFRPPPLPPSNPVPVIVSVGRLVPKKGHDYLVEAARLLHQRHVPFRLNIYGGGPLRDALQQQIATAGLEGIVCLPGGCTQDELISVYRGADIFVLAPVVTADGDRDGIPNVLLEAMASGLPSVSTNISGIPEVIVDGVTGLLTPSGDPATLAAALESLLASAPLRARLGQAACEAVARRFDATDNARVMAALLGVEGGIYADRVRAR